jgi:hypothetical protein
VRRIALLIWLALVGVHLAIGATWIAENVDTVPDYGDTGEYLQLARTLEVDAYRGIGYPAFIAGVDKLPGGAGLLRSAGRGGPRSTAKLGRHLEGLQFPASPAALAWFPRLVVPGTVAPGRPWTAARRCSCSCCCCSTRWCRTSRSRS